jgi:hypothetical protein
MKDLSTPTENEIALLDAFLKLHEHFQSISNTLIAAAKVVENLVDRVVELESKVNTQQ